MYSRSKWEKSGFTVPPGYDGSRFRRNHPRDGDVIIVPDSGFAHSERDDDTLSVSGIPTSKGIKQRRSSAYAENETLSVDAVADFDAIALDLEKNTHDKDAERDDCATDDCAVAVHTDTDNDHSESDSKLSGILDKFGFGGKLSSDELLLCAVIFIIASDGDNTGRNTGDILLILALLLGLR